MSSDNQNYKKNEKQIPSLNEYSSKPWTEWVNKTANISSILVDNGTNSLDCPNIRLLPRKDVNLYGLYPKMDQRVLNECDRCRAIVLPEAFRTHTFKTHSQKDSPSEITLIKKKHTVKSKKKNRFVTVRVPAPPLFQFPPSYDSKSATAESEQQQQQQKEEEDGREQLIIFNDDSDNKSNELGFEGSGGGHTNTSSSETGSGSATPKQPTDPNIIQNISTADRTDKTPTAACGEAENSSNISPPPLPPPPPSPPPPPPLQAALSGSGSAATNNVASSSSTASVSAFTVTIRVVAATSTNNAPIAIPAVTTVPAASSATDSVVSSANPTYRRQKKSSRTSRSAAIAALASNTTTPATSQQLVDVDAQAARTNAASLNTTTVVTSISSSSLRTKSCNIIASVKLPLPITSPKTTRRSTVSTTSNGQVPVPVPIPIPAVPVRIPVPIPAVIPRRHPVTQCARTGHMVRSVLGTGLYPRTLASVRVRSMSNRCMLSKSFNTTIPSPSQHATGSPQPAPQCLLPSYIPTPSCIVAAHPVALISPMQVSVYKTQPDQHFIFTNTRTANTTYHGHPKPLTLGTSSTRRLGDSYLLQGQRVDSQLHDIQTYLSKRFPLNNKNQSSDLHLQQDQSSPSQQHHSNPHNHHRPNILKNSNSTGGSPRMLIGTKRPSFTTSAKEDASTSSPSPSSSPAAKLRRTSSSTSVAEVNGIILHADVSSESAAEAPSFSLPTSLDSGDSGVPLSPTETMNAIQAIAVPPDTCASPSSTSSRCPTSLIDQPVCDCHITSSNRCSCSFTKIQSLQ